MKTIRHENYRVVVEPEQPRWMTDKKRILELSKETCHSIAEAIRRHVDDVGSVDVVCDTVTVCEHCGYAWDDESSDYNGGCCTKDQEAHDAKVRA